MGAWDNDFISNDSFLDMLADFEALTPPEQINFFNTLQKKAEAESQDFKLSEDHLPLEIPADDEEAALQAEQDLVSPDQSTEERELFLGFIQHCLEKNIHQLLTIETLTTAQTVLKQLSHKNLLSQWEDPTGRFNEIFLLQEKIARLLQKH